MYQFAVIVYYGESTEQRISIFDHFQNGMPLSVGERLHSMCEISPLVMFTKKLLLTPGSGLHDRSALVWGIHGGDDKRDPRRKGLLNAVALVAGMAFGPDAITRKWSDFQNQDTNKKYLSRPIDEVAVQQKVEALISIYEQVEARRPMRGKPFLHKQWDVGQFSGYIIYSFWEPKMPSDTISYTSKMWVEFLVGVRSHPERIANILHRGNKEARSWNRSRWACGYANAINPEGGLAVAPAVDSDDDDEE